MHDASNRGTFSYTLSYQCGEIPARLSHPAPVEKDGRGWRGRDGINARAEKGTVRRTKRYGRETAEIDIFPGAAGEKGAFNEE